MGRVERYGTTLHWRDGLVYLTGPLQLGASLHIVLHLVWSLTPVQSEHKTLLFDWVVYTPACIHGVKAMENQAFPLQWFCDPGLKEETQYHRNISNLPGST